MGIAVVVFGVMIYSLLKFRHSQGADSRTPTMVHSTKVEIIWTIIPVLILVVMAVPAADLILKQEDTRNSELSIKVTGYQWKWQYHLHERCGHRRRFLLDPETGLEFRPSAELRRRSVKTVPNYLLDVDKPLVIPSGTKVRLLLTSMDVIHAWWVPDFGAKRSAIPGFVNELWFKVDAGKEGIYRGQCAALCGRDHAFMPVVVDVRTPDDFKKWVEEQKASAAPATTAAMAPATAQPRHGPSHSLNRRFHAYIIESTPAWPTITQSTPLTTTIITESRLKASSAGCSPPTTRTSARCTWCSA